MLSTTQESGAIAEATNRLSALGVVGPAPTPSEGETPEANATTGESGGAAVNCSQMPEQDFAKVWIENDTARERIGCPTETAKAVDDATDQHFEGGYMLRDGTVRKIYVALASANGSSFSWYEFDDTWENGEAMPGPTAVPPDGFYVPERGFGKIYYDPKNVAIREALGWALEPGQLVRIVYQVFEHGAAYWTDDGQIQFVYEDGTGQTFDDTYATPTP